MSDGFREIDAIEELEKMTARGDTEVLHSRADNILLEALEQLGYPALAKAYRAARARVGFWYS